jgi:hypothetical protein
MKIRIKGNAMQCRLTKSDITNMATNGYLQEQTNFAGQPFIYALKVVDDDTMSAAFSGNTITLFMPMQMATELLNGALYL